MLTVVNPSQIDLSWTASSDNMEVSEYLVYSDNTEISSTSSMVFSHSGLLPNTTYCYKVLACDTSGNESAHSTQSCATTDSLPLSWTVLTLDSQGDVGLSTSISTNALHISYYDSTNNQLKYANFSSGAWDTPISLINEGSISLETTFSALALDSQDNIFISYYDATTVLNGDLRLISCPAASDCSQSASWSNVLIDSTGDVGSDTSMNIDLLDNIHISYYDSDNGYLKYASCLSGSNCIQDSSWTKSIIDNSGDVGQYSSIASDSINNIHISYYDSAGLFVGNLKYAFCSVLNDCSSPSNWDTTAIDSSGDVGQYSSIAADSGNNIHIIYYDFENNRLKYATCSSTGDCTQSNSWEISIVDDTASVGEFSSITTDENDNVQISYYDSDNKDLKYAVKRD
jgi:hypothetical protein